MSDNRKVRAFIADYHRRHRAIPTKGLICHETRLTLDEVNTALQALVSEGYLTRYQDKVLLKPTSVTPVASARAVKTPINLTAVVRWVMAAVSAVAVVISAGYSYVWVSQFLDPIRAMLLSAAVVVYVTFAPEGAGLTWRVGTAGSRVMSVLLLLTGVAALVFSMSMTVIGQYNIMSDRLQAAAEATVGVTKGTDKLALLRAEVVTQERAVAGLEADLAAAQESPDDVARLNRLQNMLYHARSRLTAARQAVLSYLNTADAAVEAQVRREDVYTYLGKLLVMSPASVEFILYLIPAVFMDIIAPLGMFVALGLKRNWEP